MGIYAGALFFALIADDTLYELLRQWAESAVAVARRKKPKR